VPFSENPYLLFKASMLLFILGASIEPGRLYKSLKIMQKINYAKNLGIG
jgi:hypothetical protein